MIVTTTCDENYLPLLKCMLRSIYRNSEDTGFYLRLVDIKDKEKVHRDLVGIYPNIEINFDDQNLSCKRDLLKRKGLLLYDSIENTLKNSIAKSKHPLGVSFSKWMVSRRQCYCSNIRYRNIYEIINRGNEALYLDTDVLVRSSLENLEEIIKENDICIKLTMEDVSKLGKQWEKSNAYPDNHGWQCGLIGCSPTEQSKKFIKKTMERAEADMFFWDSDQFAFHESYKDMGSSVLIHLLEDKFKDDGRANEGYSEKSIIWSGGYTKKNK